MRKSRVVQHSLLHLLPYIFYVHVISKNMDFSLLSLRFLQRSKLFGVIDKIDFWSWIIEMMTIHLYCTYFSNWCLWFLVMFRLPERSIKEWFKMWAFLVLIKIVNEIILSPLCSLCIMKSRLILQNWSLVYWKDCYIAK